MTATTSLSLFNTASFDACLAEAVEAAQVGFYFEEGGCWGMAEALFTKLSAAGLKPQLVFRPTGFVHAWVMLDGVHLDWRGVFNAAPGWVNLADVAALRHVAADYGGTKGEGYLSDVALGTQVLEDALLRMA